MAEKQFILLTLLLAGVALCSSSYYVQMVVHVLDNPEIINEKLQEGFKWCPENTTNEEKYKDVFEEYLNCSKRVTPTNVSLCHNVEQNIQNCSQPLLNYFEDCFPENSKQLPKIILKGVQAMIKLYCTTNGELLLETMNSCIYEYFEEDPDKEECKKQTLRTYMEEMLEFEVPPVLQFCQFSRYALTCWQESVNTTCSNSKAREIFSKLMDAALSGCKK